MRLRFAHGKPEDLESMHPAYFALVMATGIVALAARLHGIPAVPTVLFWANLLFFIILVFATGTRVILYPRAVAADLSSHSRAVGFFTSVAACGIFGSQLILQMNRPDLATWFWFLALILWFLSTYGILTLLTVKPDKPSLADGLNGGWLVSVVATQSLSILTTLVSSNSASTEPMMFLALGLWLGGGALYLWLMTLIFFRYTFWRMEPDDLTPPYWINMGAVAISTLAGATLLQSSSLSPVVREIVPFVKGFTLFFWAIGSWWIPMLLALGIWRYLLRGVAFQYDPLYWGGVFPLGMYSVCTYRLSQVVHASFLMPLSYWFSIIALVAWSAAFTGLIDSSLHSLLGRRMRRIGRIYR